MVLFNLLMKFFILDFILREIKMFFFFLYRSAAMLRQLAQYHAKDPNNLFMVRLAQGLTHLGKGTMTLSPYHSDKQLMSPVAVAGLLATCLAFLDAKTRNFL